MFVISCICFVVRLGTHVVDTRMLALGGMEPVNIHAEHVDTWHTGGDPFAALLPNAPTQQNTHAVQPTRLKQPSDTRVKSYQWLMVRRETFGAAHSGLNAHLAQLGAAVDGVGVILLKRVQIQVKQPKMEIWCRLPKIRVFLIATYTHGSALGAQVDRQV